MADEKKVEQEERVKLSNMIKYALLRDVDLTEEEYRQKRLTDDRVTKAHGIKGRGVTASESIRARRMAMNFYGTILNIMMNMHATALETLAEQKKQTQLLEALFEDTPEVKEEQNE